ILDFDTYVYLPLNNKFIKYSAKNSKFSDKKKQKMIDKDLRNLHVDIKDVDKFYEYSATQLAELSSSANPLSETEKEQKLYSAIRDIFYQVLDENATPDFTAGKAMLGTCQKIISNFITQGESSNWYAQLIRTMSGQTGDYSHASEVSTYAALFAIGLQYPNVEDLAIAGMLHDIGLVEIPQDLSDKAELDEDSLTDEEKELYFSHIAKGLDIVKRNRMVLQDHVIKAIEQHHEKWNGKGYPKGKAGNTLSIEAQILSVADKFQNLVAEKPGKKRFSPSEAIEEIKNSGAVSNELYGKLRKLFNVEMSKN
ncbi:MAG: HD domain-containing protein, partial [Bdellovibrionales bacterium]|nr:HD domain-containing protein [Bdellovibrionales bacterium]